MQFISSLFLQGTFGYYTSFGQNLMGEMTGYTFKVTKEGKNSLGYILYLLQNYPLPMHLPNSPQKYVWLAFYTSLNKYKRVHLRGVTV
jgi:hypothetical protein